MTEYFASARMTPQPVIHVAAIRKTYGGTVAVDDVSFEVQPGEIFGLIGPNGAGKTTTMECVEGLRTPDRGVISVLGLDPAHCATEWRSSTTVASSTSARRPSSCGSTARSEP